MSKIIRVLVSMIVTVLWLLVPLQVHADDTEIFFSRDFGDDISPNVLFALDTSGSMELDLEGDPEGRTRLQAMKEAMVGFLNAADNVNVGLMRFNGLIGGGSVIHPVVPIDQAVCESGNCNDLIFTANIASSEDDAEETLSSNIVDVNNDAVLLGNNSNSSVALRFEDLKIPSGAVINSAKLIVTSAAFSNRLADFEIRVEDSNSSTEIKAENGNLTNRPTTGTIQPWPIREIWRNGSSYESPDIKPLIQGIVQKPGWCGGSALTLHIDGSGTRSIQTYELNQGQEARLVIGYDVSNIGAGQGCSIQSFEKNINAETDDARERLTTGQVDRYASNSARFFLTHTTNSQKGIMGLRFNDLNIPKGAKIRDAYLEFVAVYLGRNTANLTIQGLADNNTPTFLNQNGDISRRPTTSANIPWQDVPRMPPGQSYRSPDISSIVQELVNKGEWNEGNAMGFRIDSDGNGLRRVESYDTNTAFAPKLFVEYETYGVSQATVRDELINITENMSARGGTPIVDVLYEGARYFRGEDLFFGNTRGRTYRWQDFRHRYHRVSHPDSYTGGTLNTPSQCVGEGREEWDDECRTEIITASPKYISPIQSECQPNSIVLLSDGAPSTTYFFNHLTSAIGTSEGCSFPTCLNPVAEWISSTDHAPRIPNEQPIKIHSINYAAIEENDDETVDEEQEADEEEELTVLQQLAKSGQGQYFEAATSEQLRRAFEKIADLEQVSSTTFTTPGTAVNQFNRLTNQNSVFFSLFEPSQGASWPGNLKKYNLLTADDNTVQIVDVNDRPAVDPDTGFFFDTAKSEWSTTVDGEDVSAGGAASKIQLKDPTTNRERDLYTYTGTGLPNNEDLAHSRNRLHEDNAAITEDMMSIEGRAPTHRTDLLRWARGVDVFDEDGDEDTEEVRLHIGDPMHSGPLAVNYASSGAPKSYVFVTTNEGYLHVIDQATGEEEFAFVPQELLQNLDRIQENDVSGSHVYGLDGQLSFYTDDTNQDGLVDSNETALLYFGMRRGGSNYYALDVADLDNPKLKWVIKGGPDGTPGFEELGQSWARAEVARIQSGNQGKKPVLVMGAGYDQNKDDTPNSPTLPRRPDNIGRGVFIVDALTGERLWSASPTRNGNNHEIIPELQYSVPASVRVIDVDGDGFSDQMYVGDTGGQLFRFDFTNDATSSLLATGGLLADFGGNDAEGARRFYYPPDLSLLSKGNRSILSLSIGSGWRAHPLDDEIEDNFYTLHLPITFGPQDGYGKPTNNGTTTTYSPYTESDLLDVTNDLSPDATDINSHSGWRIAFDDSGEKTLSGALTVEGKIVFTTYKPNFGDDLCSVAPGLARVYAVDSFDGSPVTTFTAGGNYGGSNGLSSNPSKEDRFDELATSSIAPTPSNSITEDGTPALHVGTEIIDGIFTKSLTERTWWMEAINGN